MPSINGKVSTPARTSRVWLNSFLEGIDVNSLFTSLLKNGSTSVSWYGSYSGAHHVFFSALDGVHVFLRSLYKTRIWMASLQGPAGHEQ
jgi:hypothetical protein